jgi:uncharacterized metal-binding protein YceD (DUF177 family)
MKRDDLLDLNDVLQHPGRTIAVEISTEMENEADIDLITPLEGYLEAVSTGNLLLLTGSFSTRAVVECSRCGKAIEVDIAFDLDEQFPVEGTPSSMNPQDQAVVKDEEPYPLFDGNHLMVEALLRQDLLVGMPLQAYCPEGCEMATKDTASGSGGRLEFKGLEALKGLTEEEKE